MLRNKLIRRVFALIVSSVFLMIAGALTTAISSSAQTKNNNGTVDVNNVVAHVGNEPKVACPFDVTFSGFDPGQVVTAEIDAHAPSGSGSVWEGTQTMDNSGAGQILVTGLDLSGLKSIGNNGVHLSLGVLGEQQKSKTFWANCDPPVVNPTTTTTEAPTTTTTPTTVASTPTTAVATTIPSVTNGVNSVSSDVQPAVLAAQQTAAPAAAPAAAPRVLGTTVPRAELAHTGPQTKNLLIIATWLFALGGALVTFSKLGRVPAEG